MWRMLAGLALAAGVACIPFISERAATQARHRRVGDEAERKAREGAELAREALDLQIESVALMADNAVANPRFFAALRGRVNRGTFADLLATESWWEPYRSTLAAISYDGETLAFAQTEGAEGVSVGALVKRVAESGLAARAALLGPGGGFLVAARPVRLGRDRAAVLALARRIDDALLQQVARYGGRDVLLSDGERALGRAGADAALLEPLAGHERTGHFALREPAIHAAATELAPGLWVWALGRAGDFERAAIAGDRSRQRIVWGTSIGLALAVAVVSLRPGPRRRHRERGARDEHDDVRALLPAPPVVNHNVTRFGNATSTPVTVSSSTATIVRPGPGTALGRYLLVDQIGAGGMAEVYTAVSFGVGRFRRPFVIKRLRAELDGNATAVSLFIDEANLASTLVHPNVVPVFDFGEAGGSYFLAEEYVVGRDLGRVTTRLRERGDPLLSSGAILYLANEILQGLAYAHDKRDDAGRPLGLVHRDVTPANVIISERGEVKLLDFGIMKAKQRVSQTESGTVRGNVGFMSPEQARGRAVDHRSDLFSIGLVILYAATGEPTYPGDTFYDLLTAAASGLGDAQKARITALPAPLPVILERALQVDPDKRFQSSAELSAAIAPHLVPGSATELGTRVSALFGEELRAEQDRLAAALPHAPRPEPAAGAST
jgi:hypothetical protein